MIVPGEGLAHAVVARPTTLTRPMAVGGDQIQEEVEGEGDVRQEEDEDHPMAEMMMAQEGVAAAQ